MYACKHYTYKYLYICIYIYNLVSGLLVGVWAYLSFSHVLVFGQDVAEVENWHKFCSQDASDWDPATFGFVYVYIHGTSHQVD